MLVSSEYSSALSTLVLCYSGDFGFGFGIIELLATNVQVHNNI